MVRGRMCYRDGNKGEKVYLRHLYGRHIWTFGGMDLHASKWQGCKMVCWP